MRWQIKLHSKTYLYGRFLIFLLLLQVSLIFASESVFFLGNEEVGPKIGGTLFSVLLMFISYTSIQLFIALGLSKKVIRFFWTYFAIGSVLALYVSNPFFHVLADKDKPWVFTLCHVLVLSFLIYTIYLILKDIFKSEETKADHVWGGIVVFFLGVMTFAELYEIISLNSPGALGEFYELGWPNYVHCQVYSLHAISGVDSPYPNAIPVMMKIASFENVLGHLFLVVILGRLLSRPLKKANKDS